MTPESDLYDPNFCLKLPVALENERLKLVPFKPSTHGSIFFAAASLYPQIWDYIPVGPFPTEESINNDFFEGIIHSDPARTLFAIFDKTRPFTEGVDTGTFAGVIAYINSSALNLALEIGFVLTLPPFQRTHVTSNAVGLLLHYALDLPSHGGLGLRRVVWQANALNAASVKAALRMGFVKEGILRWDRVLPEWKGVGVGNGRDVRPDDPKRTYPGRDTAILGLCWDDWENGAREVVDKVMSRGLDT